MAFETLIPALAQFGVPTVICAWSLYELRVERVRASADKDRLLAELKETNSKLQAVLESNAQKVTEALGRNTEAWRSAQKAFENLINVCSEASNVSSALHRAITGTNTPHTGGVGRPASGQSVARKSNPNIHG